MGRVGHLFWIDVGTEFRFTTEETERASSKVM
jgi:hypothetical protein